MTVQTGNRSHRTQFSEPLSLPREAFIEEYWDYQAGEHVLFAAPTQAGKTTLAFQLLGETATPELPAIVLVMKPRDPTVRKWVDHYKAEDGWREVKTWPPIARGKRSGYVLWPRHSFDIKRDNPELKKQMQQAIKDSYKRGNNILFADEIFGLTNELDLDDDVEAVWSRGSGMGAGVWAATQRPAHIPLLAYSSARHVFLANDPDRRDRIRFGEIGGVDPRFIEEIVKGLPKYHWLYIGRDGPVACIIQP